MATAADLHLAPATTDADFDAARALFRAYAAESEDDLCFQGFEQELAALPTRYGSSRTALLVAYDGAEAVGCVAIKPMGDGSGTAELVRLYVVPSHRGLGLGRRLAEAALGAATDRRYRSVRLDTRRSMVAAQALYRALGFVEVAACVACNGPDVVRMARVL